MSSIYNTLLNNNSLLYLIQILGCYRSREWRREGDERGGERMERERRVWRRVGKKEREGGESDMVWWVYERLYMCHLISG